MHSHGRPRVSRRSSGAGSDSMPAVGIAPRCRLTAAHGTGFVATLIRHFRLAAPVVDALNTPIAAALVPKKRVLFGLH